MWIFPWPAHFLFLRVLLWSQLLWMLLSVEICLFIQEERVNPLPQIHCLFMITHIRSHRRWIPYRKITVAMVILAKRYSFWGIHMNWISSSVSRKRFTKSWYYDEKLLDYGRKLVTKLGNLLMTAVLLLQRCAHTCYFVMDFDYAVV